MSSTDEIVKLVESLYAVDRVLMAIQKKPNEYAGISLYASEAHTPKLIAQNEGISQMGLSEQIYRTKGVTSIMVDKLVEKRSVNRNWEGGNQRRYLLTLTEPGRVVSQAHMDYDDEHARWVTEGLELTEEELQVTDHSLNRIIGFYSGSYLDHEVSVTSDKHRQYR